MGKTTLVRSLKSVLGGGKKKTRSKLPFFDNTKKHSSLELEIPTQHTGDTLATDGIEITLDSLPLQEFVGADKKEFPKPKIPITFSVWDFAGK